MPFTLPHFEKFVPAWIAIALVGFAVVAIVVVFIVLATTGRRRQDDPN